jgi:hemolysin D
MRLQGLQALADLARRYAQVFGHAWRQRRATDTPALLDHEAHFLPAALALRDTPVHPAPRIVMWLIMLFAFGALVWSYFGRIDIVAVAAGQVVLDDRTKLVQPIETATITAIHVRDGQFVEEGAVLVELDPTATRATLARIDHEFWAAQYEAARARALLAALDNGQRPVLGAMDSAPPGRRAEEQRVLDGQYAEFVARLAALDADILRREAELAATQQLLRKLEQTVPIAQRRAADFQALVEQNFVSRHMFLDKEQARIEQEGQLAAQTLRVAELGAALQAGRNQRQALVAESRRLALDQHRQAEQRAAALQQELVKARHRGGLMTITAPASGTVQQLAVHTVGGVVTPAQPLMVVVPADNPVEVVAKVVNRDIGFVQPGQRVEVKVETFPFTRYGTLAGQVLSISRDAVADEVHGLVFPARIALERSTLQVRDREVPLSSGMAVTVEVKTGKRRIIEYFLSPLLRAADESLRER